MVWTVQRSRRGQSWVAWVAVPYFSGQPSAVRKPAHTAGYWDTSSCGHSGRVGIGRLDGRRCARTVLSSMQSPVQRALRRVTGLSGHRRSRRKRQTGDPHPHPRHPPLGAVRHLRLPGRHRVYRVCAESSLCWSTHRNNWMRSLVRLPRVFA